MACGVQTFRKNLRNLRERRRQQHQLENELDTVLNRLQTVIDQPNQPVYSTALDVLQERFATRGRNYKSYAEEKVPPDDATAADRFAAFAGRRP